MTGYREVRVDEIRLSGSDAVMLAGILLLHLYLWWRLVRSTTHPDRARRWLTVLLVVLALLLTAAFVVPYPPVPLVPVQWVGFSWLGLSLYTALSLLLLEPVRAAVGMRLRRRAHAAVPAPIVGPTTGPAPQPPEESRRLFVARGLAAGTVALGIAGNGARDAASAPVVRRLPVTLTGLDPALDGMRLVTFSDAHLSSTYRGRRFERVVETVNAQRPDAIAIVGDLVDGELNRLREEVAPVADLSADQGVYFVTGNHEYYVDTLALLRHLETLDVRILRNERVPIRRGGASFDLAGVDDVSAAESGLAGHRANLDAALDGRDAATPVVLLAHQPVQIRESRSAGVDLQLSGHTHGGRLWPLDYAARLTQPEIEGYSRHGDTQLYVTSGSRLLGTAHAGGRPARGPRGGAARPCDRPEAGPGQEPAGVRSSDGSGWCLRPSQQARSCCRPSRPPNGLSTRAGPRRRTSRSQRVRVPAPRASKVTAPLTSPTGVRNVEAMRWGAVGAGQLDDHLQRAAARLVHRPVPRSHARRALGELLDVQHRRVVPGLVALVRDDVEHHVDGPVDADLPETCGVKADVGQGRRARWRAPAASTGLARVKRPRGVIPMANTAAPSSPSRAARPRLRTAAASAVSPTVIAAPKARGAGSVRAVPTRRYHPHGARLARAGYWWGDTSVRVPFHARPVVANRRPSARRPAAGLSQASAVSPV
ncbi:metallophosphoesterase [Geodermatophilus sp. SYSU D01176]